MATAVIASRDANFETQILKIKIEIESRFRELISCVTKREKELLNQLKEILNNYKRKRDKHKQSITELETGLNLVQENFKSNDLKHLQESMIEQITKKRKEFNSQFGSKHISLDFDKTILELAGTIGRLTVTNSTSVVSSLPVVDYEGKVTPVLSIGGTSGGKEGQFSNPYGVAVHYQTGNIVVADQSNNRVQVFDEEAPDLPTRTILEYKKQQGVEKSEFEFDIRKVDKDTSNAKWKGAKAISRRDKDYISPHYVYEEVERIKPSGRKKEVVQVQLRFSEPLTRSRWLGREKDRDGESRYPPRREGDWNRDRDGNSYGDRDGQKGGFGDRDGNRERFGDRDGNRERFGDRDGNRERFGDRDGNRGGFGDRDRSGYREKRDDHDDQQDGQGHPRAPARNRNFNFKEDEFPTLTNK